MKCLPLTLSYILIFFQVLFITFGVFGFMPTCHYILRFGVEHAFSGIYLYAMNKEIELISLLAGATHYLLIVAALYIIGAGLYAGKYIARKREREVCDELFLARIPERWAPGLFDIWVRSLSCIID